MKKSQEKLWIFPLGRPTIYEKQLLCETEIICSASDLKTVMKNISYASS